MSHTKQNIAQESEIDAPATKNAVSRKRDIESDPKKAFV